MKCSWYLRQSSEVERLERQKLGFKQTIECVLEGSRDLVDNDWVATKEKHVEIHLAGDGSSETP